MGEGQVREGRVRKRVYEGQRVVVKVTYCVRRYSGVGKVHEGGAEEPRTHTQAMSLCLCLCPRKPYCSDHYNGPLSMSLSLPQSGLTNRWAYSFK